jgi:hypothetical protein
VRSQYLSWPSQIARSVFTNVHLIILPSTVEDVPEVDTKRSSPSHQPVPRQRLFHRGHSEAVRRTTADAVTGLTFPPYRRAVGHNGPPDQRRHGDAVGAGQRLLTDGPTVSRR